MKYFSLPNISKNLLDSSITNYLITIGNSLEASNWTIRPFKFDSYHQSLVKPILNQLPLMPVSMAILMTPAFAASAVHVDNFAPDLNGIHKCTGRISAINVALENCESCFEYIGESNTVLDQITFDITKCLRVDIPHRSNNLSSSKNRVTLSFSYLNSIDELYDAYVKNLSCSQDKLNSP